MDKGYSSRIIALLFLVLFLSVIACTAGGREENTERVHYHSKVEFDHIKTYLLTIDSLMMPTVSYIEYAQETHRLSLLDAVNNQIYTYQLGAQEEELQPLCVTAIGYQGNILGFKKLSNDSILFFDNDASSLRLFSFPDMSELWSVAPFESIEEAAKNYVEAGNNIVTFDSLFFGIPFIDYDHPMIQEGNSVYLPLLVSDPVEIGVPVGGRFIPSVVSIDLISNSVEYILPFSSVYDESNWGEGFFFRHTSIASYKDGKLLVSYPADHNLYSWDIASNQLYGAYAGAYNIESITPKDGTKEYTSMSMIEWGNSQPRYSTVLYDKYRDIIYRIAALPVEKNSTTNTDFRPIIVVVLDGEMNYLGEWTIPNPEEYGFASFFVSSEGLNIERKNNGDDDHIYLDVFTPIL